MKKVLILYSGGKDSLISTMLLIEQGYEVYLIHYDNSFEIGNNNIIIGIKRLQKLYGKDKIKYLGIKKIDAIFRELIKDFYNLKTNEISKNYGNITISEFNCLACRLSMYIESIIICKQENINYVADGARNSQLFSIEQNEMLNLFKNLFKKYNIELLFPVKNLTDDFEELNELLIRGFIPKVNESKCLLGMPLNRNKTDEEILNSSITTYENLLLPKTYKLIQKYKNIKIGEKYI